MTLAVLLVDVMVWIRRFVVITKAQAVAIALWVVHTHAIEASDCTPYLHVTSPLKGCGKTRLLEVLEYLVRQSWFTGRTTAAALVRKVDEQKPTLLLDESDAAFSGDKEYAESLRGVLNSGYRRSGRTTVCVGQGSKIAFRDFSTFCAKAIAGIGKLPDTVADRAIPFQLKRRTKDESCAKWRERDCRGKAIEFHERLERSAGACLEALKVARPQLPESLSDRQQDVWEPLLAIADLAGEDWPDQARKAALELTQSVEDGDIKVELLSDLADILENLRDEIVPSEELLPALTGLEDRPWASWRQDKPLSARGLASLLAPLGIHPAKHRIRNGTERRGYRRDALMDAIARYVPSHVSTRRNANDSGPEGSSSPCPAPAAPDTSEPTVPSIEPGDATHGHIDRREHVEEHDDGSFTI